ncbi:chloride channel protein [Aquimarina agarivorans]|uniref:chloride channel protein n=1 Tax=Aquimarina agarivorans TaxID=980584 RepID=UPI000248E885|nr:chloride channel protein [Aquimarina agarivorans]
MTKKKHIAQFLKWRYRHISDKNLVFLLSILVGFLAGLVSVVLKNITHFIQSFVERDDLFLGQSLYFILPIVGLLIVFTLNKYFFKRFPRHSVPTILHALSRRNGIIKRVKIWYPLIIAPITVGFGGSVGLLGPAILSGATISSNLSSLFHIDSKTRTLLFGCTAAAAIAAVFNSPIAGIIFAVEVLSLDLTLTSLLPLLLASLSGVITSYLFLGDEVLFRFNVADTFKINDLPFYIFLGIGTAFTSVYFTKMYFGIFRLFSKLNNNFYRFAISVTTIGLLLYFIPPLYGEGLSFINSLLTNNHLAALGKTPFDDHINNVWVVITLLFGITVFKAIAMTSTLAAGGAGGIIIPTLVMGSALGTIVAKLINHLGLGFHVSESNFTLVGMAGLIAGVLHAPLTAIFLIAEISGGYELFIPLMITVTISFLITKHFIEHSIYTQELAEKGQLITHNKDEMVLLLMKLDPVIETNFVSIKSEATLGDLVHNVVAKSTRNIFPVVDNDSKLLGIVLLDDIRDIMFDQSYYKNTTVQMLMKQVPEIITYETDTMKSVMKKFQDTGAWNLPVIKNGTYYGFISKSKLLTAYRRKLISFTR